MPRTSEQRVALGLGESVPLGRRGFRQVSLRYDGVSGLPSAPNQGYVLSVVSRGLFGSGSRHEKTYVLPHEGGTRELPSGLGLLRRIEVHYALPGVMSFSL